MKKIISILLCCAIVCSTLVGCGNQNNAANSDKDGVSNADTEFNKEIEDGHQGEVGRYVESSIDLSDKLSYPNGLTRLEDGSLTIGNCSKESIHSKDNGKTWEVDEKSLVTQLFKDKYVTNLATAPDGTNAVIYVESTDENDSNLFVYAQIVKADGSIIDIQLENKDYEIYKLWFNKNNELFLTAKMDTVYKVDTQTGEIRELFKTEHDTEYVTFQDNYIFALGYGGLTIFDESANQKIEDKVLVDFLEEQYQFEQMNHTDGTDYQYYLFPGESGVIYIAGGKGLYRHVISGSSVEQVIEGSLSSLADPSKSIVSMMELENNEFLTLFTDGKLVQFTYDSSAPAVPTTKLKVFSLYEDDLIKQAITLYQTSNPEMFVEYEVGIEKGSSITRDDALKTLNTKILASEGPDIMVLDDMPIASYLSKDMLMDLSTYLDDDMVFSNVTEAFTKDNKTYLVPGQMQLPVIFGNTSELNGVTDFTSLVPVAQNLREQSPDKDLFGMYSEMGVLKSFAKLFGYEFTNKDGTLNQEQLKLFLSNSKAMYDLQKNGTPEKMFNLFEKRSNDYLQEEGTVIEDEIYFNMLSAQAFHMGERAFSLGCLMSSYGFFNAKSIKRTEGFQSADFLPLMNDGEKVFVPRTLIAISSASKSPEVAADFIKTLLGNECQALIGETGLPVNEEAFWKFIQPEEETDEPLYGMSSSSFNGPKYEIDIYGATMEERKELLEYAKSVSHPYVKDSVVETAILEYGVAYLDGTASLEDTMQKIESKISIYLAE